MRIPPADDPWRGLAPTFTWRGSQRHLLDLASHVTDHRWHLCAPPGSGKTLVGLELARRVGAPTLVLSPTTAVRDQWRAATALFGADPAVFTSDDLEAPAPLVAVTYQLLGNPGEAAADLRAAARRLWLAEASAEVGAVAAEARLLATETHDPARARRELDRHVRALRRTLADGPDAGPTRLAVPRSALLGARAERVVQALASRAFGCVILDECHHLLDWWALVVSELVERLGAEQPVAVVGLTASLPEPASEREASNYRGLLGDVDAELHLAALVAEGTVAPWRDALRVTPVTDAEAAFLDDWSARFAADLDEQLTDEAFVTWAVAQVGGAALDARAAELAGGPVSTAGAWDAFWDRDPLAGAALARWWGGRGLALPAGFDPPPGATGPLGLADRLTLVDAWLHDPAGSADPDRRRALERLGARHGVAFTTRGVRSTRSVADLVCARSEAKGRAAADVLAAESARRGASLRALVVVERDTATTPPAAARTVLGEDAGTAARVLAALCTHGAVLEHGIVAVTGRGAWADAVNAPRIAAAMNVAAPAAATADSADGRWVSAEGCDVAGAVRLRGHGAGWSASAWLAVAEAALDGGAAGVLLATRGLVGEGWDHPALNVLVDLSEAASPTATTQLRGRVLRLDPGDPAKLASLWDVAAVHPAAPGDWHRIRRRHQHWWGPGPGGAVITGPAKLHPLAARPTPPDADEQRRINEESAAALADVAGTRAAWAAVDPAGVATSIVHLQPRRWRTVRTRGRRWRLLAGSAVASGAGAVALALLALAPRRPWRGRPRPAPSGPPASWGGRHGAGGGASTTRPWPWRTRSWPGSWPPGGTTSGPGARVRPDPSGGWASEVTGVDDVAAAAWAAALAETLGPLGRPRWLVAAGDRAWRVPLAVGATREAADAFARRFRQRVPGAELLRAGDARATVLVLAAANERRDEITGSLRWR